MEFSLTKERCQRLAEFEGDITVGAGILGIRPSGYEFPIRLPVITSGSRAESNAWTWNGDLEKPTLKPSVLTDHGNGKISHLWLNDGICQHLSDSTDGLAGKTLPLQALDEPTN